MRRSPNWYLIRTAGFPQIPKDWVVILPLEFLPCRSAHERMEQGRSLEDALTWRMWAYYPRWFKRKIQFLLRVFLHWRMQWIQGKIYLVKVNNSKPRLWRWHAVRFHLSTKVDPEISVCLCREVYHIAYIWELFLCFRCERFLQICLLDGDFQFSLSIYFYAIQHIDFHVMRYSS